MASASGTMRLEQRRAVGDRRVLGADAHDGAASQSKTASWMDAATSDADAREARRLGDDERTAGLADRRRHGREVQRHHRAQVDDLRLDAVRRQALGRLERLRRPSASR